MGETDNKNEYSFLISMNEFFKPVYLMGTPGSVKQTKKTLDIPFYELANNFGLRNRLNLIPGKYTFKKEDDDKCYSLKENSNIKQLAEYIADCGNDEELQKRKDYLINNGLVRILFIDNDLMQKVKQKEIKMQEKITTIGNPLQSDMNSKYDPGQDNYENTEGQTRAGDNVKKVVLRQLNNF